MTLTCVKDAELAFAQLLKHKLQSRNWSTSVGDREADTPEIRVTRLTKIALHVDDDERRRRRQECTPSRRALLNVSPRPDGGDTVVSALSRTSTCQCRMFARLSRMCRVYEQHLKLKRKGQQCTSANKTILAVLIDVLRVRDV